VDEDPKHIWIEKFKLEKLPFLGLNKVGLKLVILLELRNKWVVLGPVNAWNSNCRSTPTRPTIMARMWGENKLENLMKQNKSKQLFFYNNMCTCKIATPKQKLQ
jgi:hypothetical protein